MNGIKIWTKISCMFLTAVILCSGVFLDGRAENAVTGDVSPAEGTSIQNDASLCAQTDSLELYLNEKDMTFSVKNKANDYVWYSNPPERAEDSYSFGINKMEMSAFLTISYIRKSTGNEDKINSYTGSVVDGNFTVSDIEDGFRVDFRFEEIALTVPVEIQLKQDGLMVKVLTGSMVQKDKDVFVEKISVLQYFGAGKAEEEGYLLIPDGCGALIYFDNGKYSSEEYSMPVYGEERTADSEHPDLDLDSRKISLPVYGIKRKNNACLVILEDGAELANIKANTGRQITGYANAYAQYRLYGKMKYTLAKSETMIYEQTNEKLTDVSLKFQFLTDTDADYSGMARAYRKYLREKKALPKTNIQQDACYVTLHGAVMKKVSWLGLVTESAVPLTTVSETNTICEQMRQKGIDNIVINYLDWNKQELTGKQITGVGIARNLGSLKDLNKLQKEGQTIYVTLSNILQYRKQGFFGRFTNTVCDISGMALRLNQYSVSLGLPLKDQRYYLLTSSKVSKRAEDLAKDIEKKSLLHVGLDDMGSLLYNDYREGSVKRNDTKAVMEKGLQTIRKTAQRMLLDNPNQYALVYASDVVNLPTGSSGQNLIDEDVPFEQLVLSGSVRYAADAMNFTDAKEGLLKALETGSMLHYEGYYRESSAVKGTKLSHLCNGSIDLFMGKMTQQYQTLLSARKAVANSTLYAHQKITENVYAAVYENGVKILVNYSDTEYLLKNGNSVPAGGYLIEQGAE